MMEFDDDDKALLMAVEQTETNMCGYTDGCCLGNGKADCCGGYGFVICQGTTKFALEKIVHEFHYGSTEATTNNRMEMTAVLEALRWIQVYQKEQKLPKISIHIYSDSQYTLQWLSNVDKWEQNNWVSATTGKEVANKDLWIALRAVLKECAEHDIFVRLVKVKAHLYPSDPEYDPGNAFADDLANQWHVENDRKAAKRRNKKKKTLTKKSPKEVVVV